MRTDALFWRSPNAAFADLEAMRQAFTGIARIFSEAGILIEELLRDELPQFVWDSAIAGGWYRFASETAQAIFPGKIGHHWVWRDENTDWKNLFYSETGEWLAWRLENPNERERDPSTLRQKIPGDIDLKQMQVPVPIRPPSDLAAEGGDDSSPATRGDNSFDFDSEAGRNKAIGDYIKYWTTDSYACSEASLARTARVDPADLSKWKKGSWSTGSDKTARIEEALIHSKPPTPPPTKKSEI
jgi:hypothetical protein